MCSFLSFHPLSSFQWWLWEAETLSLPGLHAKWARPLLPVFGPTDKDLLMPGILQTVARACSLTCSPFCHRWMVTSWSPCTRSCGGGIQTRRVTCQRLTATGNSVPMSNEACAQVSKRPVDTQNCNRQPCVEWVASSWGQVRNEAAFQGQPLSVG